MQFVAFGNYLIKAERRAFSFGGQYYTIINFNEVDIRIYLPEKVITFKGR